MTRLRLTVMAILVLVGTSQSFAQIITPTSTTISGSFNNTSGLLSDGIFPAEGSVWTAPTNVWWTGQTGTTGVVAVFDLGALYDVVDAKMSFDNNDSYAVDWSIDNATWAGLFMVAAGVGEIGSGMDTFSTVSGDPEYIASIDFVAVQAQFLRVYATGGDNNYSIGEFQALGTAVPEPGFVSLLYGVVAIAGLRRRRK